MSSNDPKSNSCYHSKKMSLFIDPCPDCSKTSFIDGSNVFQLAELPSIYSSIYVVSIVYFPSDQPPLFQYSVPTPIVSRQCHLHSVSLTPNFKIPYFRMLFSPHSQPMCVVSYSWHRILHSDPYKSLNQNIVVLSKVPTVKLVIL